MFSVWVGGSEVVAHLIETEGEAQAIAREWTEKGYDDAVVVYYQEEGNK